MNIFLNKTSYFYKTYLSASYFFFKTHPFYLNYFLFLCFKNLLFIFFINSFVIFKNNWQKNPFKFLFTFRIQCFTGTKHNYNFFKFNYNLNIFSFSLIKHNVNFLIKKNTINLNNYLNLKFITMFCNFSILLFYSKSALLAYFNIFVLQLSNFFLTKATSNLIIYKSCFFKTSLRDLLQFNFYLL